MIPLLVAITNTFLCPFSLTLVFISIHSSFSWRPFPIRIFVLIRLTTLNNFGYTWTGDQSANFMRLREDRALKDSYLCIPEIREGSDYQHLLLRPRTWMLERKINNLSLLICKRSWRGCNTTHVNACSDLYGYPFARSPISIVRLAIGIVQERTTTRYLAIISRRRNQELIVQPAMQMETLCLASSSIHQGSALGGQAGSLGLSIFGKGYWGTVQWLVNSRTKKES